MNVSAGLLIAGIIRCWYRRWRDSLFEQSQKCLFCQKDEVIFIVVDEVKTQLSFFGRSSLSQFKGCCCSLVSSSTYLLWSFFCHFKCLAVWQKVGHLPANSKSLIWIFRIKAAFKMLVTAGSFIWRKILTSFCPVGVINWRTRLFSLFLSSSPQKTKPGLHRTHRTIQ